ncbi:MAG: DinB family protein, partial [Candidatus Eisenbacteria bacterium]|nr:DinB family protein [Candidatus Eisenbacteria bacterium]
SDTHRAAIAQGATHYAELAKSYLARGHARAFAPRTSDTGITPGGPGPMTYAEWGGLLATFAESPEWIDERIAGVSAARLAQRPGPERWSALEVLAHLRDTDRDVFLPRLEVLLTQSQPVFTPADLTSSARVTGYAGADAAAVLSEWRMLRKQFVTRLAPLGRDDWARVALHPSRGSYPLGDMMREWDEHDRSHRRQLALALEQTP